MARSLKNKKISGLIPTKLQKVLYHVIAKDIFRENQGSFLQLRKDLLPPFQVRLLENLLDPSSIMLIFAFQDLSTSISEKGLPNHLREMHSLLNGQGIKGSELSTDAASSKCNDRGRSTSSVAQYIMIVFRTIDCGRLVIEVPIGVPIWFWRIVVVRMDKFFVLMQYDYFWFSEQLGRGNFAPLAPNVS